MNIIDILLIAVIAAAVALAVRRIIKNRKNGTCSCGCGCSGCSLAEECGSGGQKPSGRK